MNNNVPKDRIDFSGEISPFLKNSSISDRSERWAKRTWHSGLSESSRFSITQLITGEMDRLLAIIQQDTRKFFHSRNPIVRRFSDE